MKKKTKLWIAALGLLGLCLLIFYPRQEEKPHYEYSEDYVQIKELPSMLDFYYYTKKEWEEKLAEEDFGELVTPRVIDWILEQTSSKSYVTYDEGEKEAEDGFFSFSGKDKEQAVSRETWNNVYSQLLDLLNEEENIHASDEIILKKEEDSLVCSSGTYRFALKGLSVEPMTSMNFYIREDQIIGLCSLKSKSAVLSNVYVQKAEGDKVSFIFDKSQYELTVGTDGLGMAQGHVCDLLWENGTIVKVQVKEDTIQGNLMAMSEDSMEIEGYGEISRSEEMPVYKTYGTVEEKELSDIVIANMKVEYVVANECIEAVLLTEPPQISRIRVLLLSEDGSPYHEDICIGANRTYRVITKEKKKKKSADKRILASELFSPEATGSIRVKTSQKGMLYLCDASGKRISNGYQGTLELRKYPQGYAVVNELPIEQYLCSVVPSEMPVSYEPEALKAQAICARSYAYIQLGHGDYASFGAHVDDTTNYQVYNKQKRDKKTTAAVLDTAGLIIRYQDEIAEAYYFSTSAGVTEDGEPWGLDTDPAYGYLKKGFVKEGGADADLSSEEAFLSFIREPDDFLYEKGMPFFRWKASADYQSEEIQKKMQEIIKVRKERTPEEISFFNQKGKEKETMQGFGGLLKIQIEKRSKSGVILKLRLTYEKGSVLVGNEYNIRVLLGAGLTDLTLSDGSKRDFSLLPSAYTTVEPLEDGTYQMTGGGYGHGIGMSQNGAQKMAQAGKSCEEILQFFFKDIKIEEAQE